MKSVDEVSKDLICSIKPRLAFERCEAYEPRIWQETLRAELCRHLGITLDRQQSVHAQILETEHLDGYRREKIHIRADDGLALPCYLLIPDNAIQPMPACIVLHGHCSGKNIMVGIPRNDEDRELIAGDRDIAVQAVKNGFITLAPDVRGFGELMVREDIEAKRSWSCLQLAGRMLHAGKTLPGQRILDVMACVDYLVQRPDVDSQRIVMTGQSGGGTITIYTMGLDPRIAAAAPSCSFCTFADSILALYHCICNFVPSLLNTAEQADIAGLFAPKPLLIIAGRKDDIFPIGAVEKAYADLKVIYRAFSADESLELYIGEGDHRYYKERVWSFFEEHLSKSAVKVK